MEIPVNSAFGSRRNEDIALDMMKFIASATSYGKAGAPGVGFQGSVSTKAAEEHAQHLIELYGRCLEAVQAKK
jgi:hypothetical protein